MAKYSLLVCLILFTLVVSFAHASIKINEFVIDQSPQGAELINTSSNSADISSWYIDDNGGTTYFTVPQNIIIYGNSCLVFTGEFNLNKSTTDTIRLFNNFAPPTTSSALLIDSYTYKSSPGLGKSYARNPDYSDAWTTMNISLGQYNETGMNCIITPTPTLTLTLTPSPTTIPSASNTPESLDPTPLISYENIFISEVMPYPLPDENEWIELFNNNNFEVSLNNWYIDDIENSGTTPKRFSLDIPSKSFAIIDFNASIFNNNNDSVRLLDYNKVQKDGFEYENSLQNITLGRAYWDNDTFCLQTPSKNVNNTSCISDSPIPTSQTKTIPERELKEIKTSQTTNTLPIPYPKQTPLIYTSQLNYPQVLGTSTAQYAPEKKNSYGNLLPRYLSFLSGSYSILTIVSLLIKIRNGV